MTGSSLPFAAQERAVEPLRVVVELAERAPLGARVPRGDGVVAVALHAHDAVAVERDDDPAVGGAEAAEAPGLRRRDPETLPSRRRRRQPTVR